MAAPRRTQKQIAERYKGNLGYYNKKHPWRRARRWVSFLAIAGGITGIVTFSNLRPREVFQRRSDFEQSRGVRRQLRQLS